VKLDIRHQGCGKSAQTFSFEFRPPTPRRDRPAEWFRKGAAYLESLAKISFEPDGLNALAGYLRENEGAPFEEAIELSEFQSLRVRLLEGAEPGWVILEIRYKLHV